MGIPSWSGQIDVDESNLPEVPKGVTVELALEEDFAALYRPNAEPVHLPYTDAAFFQTGRDRGSLHFEKGVKLKVRASTAAPDGVAADMKGLSRALSRRRYGIAEETASNIVTSANWKDETYTEAILVFSYPGRTQADAATLFARHSQSLWTQGYRPISQSWGEGRPGAGRVLMLGEIAESIRPNGFLTVTYERERPVVAAATPVGLVDRLTQLAEAHRLGLITDEEFAAQRQKAIEAP